MVKSEIYTLNNSGAGAKAEEERLNFQHNVFLRMTKGHLLPEHIFKSLPSNARIADVGTGTGTWLNALSGRLPKARLEGFDMTPEHFPPKEKLAANVMLHGYSQNALDPFPEECLGQFDVVHVRLLMYGLKAHEWDKAFKNVVTLLKPGGWLHWEETGYISWVAIPPSKGLYDILAFDMEFAKRQGRDVTHPARLLQNAIHAELEGCAEHDYCGFELSDGHDPDVTEAIARVATQAAFGVVQKGGMEGLGTKDDAQKLVDRMRRDLETPGLEFSFDMKWVWGRKPL